MEVGNSNAVDGMLQLAPLSGQAQVTSEPGTKLRPVKSRRRFARLLLIVLGITVGLALAEVGMRIFRLGGTRTSSLYHDRLYKLPPHTSFMNYNENKNLVVTNNLGFHDRERQATNDNYRILVLGDSFVEGRQVKIESLFTSRLEKKLGQNVEVINGGVQATGTAYQYVLWQEFFEPGIKVDHLVVCFFMGNDLIDNNSELVAATSGSSDTGFFVDGKGTIVDTVEKPGWFKRRINSSRDHSVLFNSSYEAGFRLKTHFRNASVENGGGTAANVVHDNAAAWQASQQGTIALLRRWKAELAGKSVPFDLVMIDRPGRVYNKFELEFIDQVAAACAQDQIGFLRLQLGGDPFEYYSFDGILLGHFNDKGHEAVAGELYEYFQKHYQTPSDRSVRQSQ